MSAQVLDSRAIKGEYYRQLEQDTGVPWVNAISNYFPVNQLTEDYAFLGQVPAMREWVGGRQGKGLRDNTFSIKNKLFESTLELDIDQMRRDKTGQLQVRISEQVQRAQAHWAKLLTDLVIDGESTDAYDGQFFFDTDHSEGDSGSQSNDISSDISAHPTEVHGTVTAPSAEEAAFSVYDGIQQIVTLKDDQGELMNETASGFLVMCPLSLYKNIQSGLTVPKGTGLAEQMFPGVTINVVANPRLDADASPWTDKFAIFRTDSAVKPLIRQEEETISVSEKDDSFDNRRKSYGLETWRNVGYGYWQHACLVTMV